MKKLILILFGYSCFGQITLAPITSSVNLPLAQQVLASRQNAYNANSAKIQTTVDNLIASIYDLGIDSNLTKTIYSKFNTRYLLEMDSKRYDFSDTSLTNNVITWLKNGLISIVKEEMSILEKEMQTQEADELMLQIANEFASNSGHYETHSVTEENYNPSTNNYDMINFDQSLTKVFIDGVKGELHFYRQKNKGWKYYYWRYDNSETDFYEIIDVTNGNVVQVSKNFDFLIFYEEKIGKNFSKRYIYRNLTKVPIPNNKH